jgi:hypothetical protein
MPKICNGAIAKERGGPKFHTQDLQPAEVSGEEKKETCSIERNIYTLIKL